ncbi:MAG: TlpA family protein disulfide reductase [Chloroflexota bacterium]
MSKNLNDLEFLDTRRPAAKQGINWGSIVLLVGVVAAILMIGVALLEQNRTLVPNEPVPNFTIQVFDGETFNLAEYRGSIVVVNFWGSWCAPCRDEAPDLQLIHELYHDQGVILVGITHAESSDQDSIDFIEEFNLTYRNGPDPETRIADDYKITGVPETFVIDRDGRLVEGGYFPGPVTANTLITVLDQLIEEQTAS